MLTNCLKKIHRMCYPDPMLRVGCTKIQTFYLNSAIVITNYRENPIANFTGADVVYCSKLSEIAIF